MGKTPPHVKSQGGGRTRGRYEPPPKILSKKYVQVFEFQYVSVECPPGGRLVPPGPRHSAAPGSVSSLGRGGRREPISSHPWGAGSLNSATRARCHGAPADRPAQAPAAPCAPLRVARPTAGSDRRSTPASAPAGPRSSRAARRPAPPAATPDRLIRPRQSRAGHRSWV